VVNQSQIDQLLDLDEHGRPRESSEADDSPQSGAEVEAEELKSNPGVATDGPCANITGLRSQEENELFELCKEIQDIVCAADADEVIVIDDEITLEKSLTDTTDSSVIQMGIGTESSVVHTGTVVGNVINSDIAAPACTPVVEKVFVNVEDEKCYSVESTNLAVREIFSTIEPLTQSNDNTKNDNTTELNMVDYNEEESSCVLLPDDLLSCSSHQPHTLDADDILDSIESCQDIKNDTSSNECNERTNDFTDLFLNNIDSILDTYSHPVVTDQSLHPTDSSSSSSSVSVGEEWGDLLSDLFPSLTSV